MNQDMLCYDMCSSTIQTTTYPKSSDSTNRYDPDLIAGSAAFPSRKLGESRVFWSGDRDPNFSRRIEAFIIVGMRNIDRARLLIGDLWKPADRM